MANNSVDDSDVDLDLNQEPNDTPLVSAFGLEPFLNDLDAAQDTEYRIRYLAFLSARSRYRHRRRQMQNSSGTQSFPTEPAVHVNGDGDGELLVRETSGVTDRRNMETEKSCKRDCSHLVAKALEMDTEINVNSCKDGGNFFDCNICLYIAREPILTCCGHLFCWACFYKLPYADSTMKDADSTMKECPVCSGGVTDSTIVPIYGNGDSSRESKLDSSTVIPRRPKAHRVESVRQQRVARGGFHIPVTEVLRRIRTSMGAMNDDREQGAGNVDVHSGNNSSQEPLMREAAGILEHQRQRTQLLSRVITESGSSLSYISAALNNAERLVEDLETYINLRHLQRSTTQILSPIDEDSIVRNAGTSHAEEQTSPEEELNLLAPTPTSTPAPTPSSSRTNDVSYDLEQRENPGTSSIGEINLPPSSSRRRGSSSRVSILENSASHETRRRRSS